MARTRECDYCGNDIEPGTGTMFVRTSGATVHYCSSKCEKNANLGREARNLEWTESGRGDREESETTESESVDEPEVADESETEETEAADSSDEGAATEEDEVDEPESEADESESEAGDGESEEEETEEAEA